MALADTAGAIGAVTRLLHARLIAAQLGLADVTAGRPEASAQAATPRVNLFLYEVHLDGHLRNQPLDQGQPPPLWLVLRYLLTAFDDQGESDSMDAHAVLGGAMRALDGLNFLSLEGLPAATVAALGDNPEPLKLSFQDATTDLLSKLMQGTDEKYRCSIAFEVTPVLIAPGRPPRYSLLVGVDSTHDTIIGDAGIHLPVLPSMGPVAGDLFPTTVQPGDTLTISGSDLHLSDLFVRLGPVEIPIIAQRPGSLQCTVDGPIAAGTALSAGAHTVVVGQHLPSGRDRTTTPLVVGLRPMLTAAVAANLARAVPADAASPVFGDIDLTGVLLGAPHDDAILALYHDGATVRLWDTVTAAPPPVAPQTRTRVAIPADQAVPPGRYRLILRVNGQQARSSPSVDLTVP